MLKVLCHRCCCCFVVVCVNLRCACFAFAAMCLCVVPSGLASKENRTHLELPQVFGEGTALVRDKETGLIHTVDAQGNNLSNQEMWERSKEAVERGGAALGLLDTCQA